MELSVCLHKTCVFSGFVLTEPHYPTKYVYQQQMIIYTYTNTAYTHTFTCKSSPYTCLLTHLSDTHQQTYQHTFTFHIPHFVSLTKNACIQISSHSCNLNNTHSCTCIQIPCFSYVYTEERGKLGVNASSLPSSLRGSQSMRQWGPRGRKELMLGKGKARLKQVFK